MQKYYVSDYNPESSQIIKLPVALMTSGFSKFAGFNYPCIVLKKFIALEDS